MSDTASFFAKKKSKSKKKKLGVNANKVDVTSVVTVTHVDDVASNVGASEGGGGKVGEEDSDWKDKEEVRVKVVVAGSVQLADLTAETNKGSGDTEADTVAEQVRVEEIKNQLKEVRIKAKQAASGEDVKEEEKKPAVSVPTTDASGQPKKWISPRLRQAQSSGDVPQSSSSGLSGLSASNPFGGGASRYGGGSRFGGSSSLGEGNAGGIRKVDTSDTAAFPTLGGGKVLLFLS